jgi:hypothetical protein
MTRVPEPQSSRQSTKAPTFQTLKERQLAAWLRKATNQFLIISQPHNEKLQHNISKLASHLMSSRLPELADCPRGSAEALSFVTLPTRKPKHVLNNASAIGKSKPNMMCTGSPLG